MRRLSPLTSIVIAIILAGGIAERGTCQSVDPAKALAEIQQKPLSKGPHGEDPASANSITLTSDELEKIKGLKAKAAIVMHYAGNDWSQAQVAGLKAQFAKMGIDVIAVI
jgi:ribose transport system substrate-binding protein